jgi:hypothetical protein
MDVIKVFNDKIIESNCVVSEAKKDLFKRNRKGQRKKI